ncbi:MAG: transcriptional repressor [Candidatus Peribacteria bacterium]|jgi:Fe2+ or Zn2+ uptake regulation protein|nr:transcriptional repressor [Candidatus Peribacteria bacterium]
MVKIHLYQKEIQRICSHQHLNVGEIFTELKKKFPKVGISTVYRNVEEMKQNGILRQLKLP